MKLLRRILVILSLIDANAQAAGYLDQMNLTVALGLQTQGSAPATPISGWLNCYGLTSDGKVYCKNSSGTAKAFTYSGAIVNADLSGSAGITNANLANMANATFKCRTTAGTGAPEDCTSAQALAILGAFANPMTTLGDIMYENSAPARLAGNTSSTNKFLCQTGTGSVSAAPSWCSLLNSDIPAPGGSGGLGGIQANACLAHNFFNVFNIDGSSGCSQPAFTDISGRATSSQVPTDVAYFDVANVFSQPQSIGGNALTITVTNDGSTGTANNKLAKFNGNAVKTGTSDTEGAIGVVISGGGTTSSAQIAVSGIATCTSDNSTTSGDYAQISSSVAGDCTDTGSATYPASGQVVGIWRESGSAGQRTLFVLPGESLSHLSASNLTAGTTPVARGGTGLGTLTAHAVQVGAGTSTPTQVGPSSSTAFPLVSGGSSADPSYALLGVAGGGTGLATLTAHAVYVGNGTSAPSAVSVGATNQVMLGNTSSDPSFGALTIAHMTIANQALTTCTTARTVDWSTGINFTLTLTNGDACALTWSNAASGQTICIDLYQASSGGGTATITFATTTLKTATFTMTTGNSATDTICVKYNGTDYRLVPQQVFQ